MYFERHDGQAVTCDDFLAAMADANGVNLDRFGQWYGQSGTPQVHVSDRYDAATRKIHADPKQKHHPPMTRQTSSPGHSVRDRLLTGDGAELTTQLETGTDVLEGTRLLVMEDEIQEYDLCQRSGKAGAVAAPGLIPRRSRLFMTTHLTACHPDDARQDAFVRWEAAQLMAQSAILEICKRSVNGLEMQLRCGVAGAFHGMLSDRTADPALLAEAMNLPDEDYLAEQMQVVDVDGIHAARKFVQRGLAGSLMAHFAGRYAELNDGQAYQKSAAAMARRALKNTCLAYLVETGLGESLAVAQLASVTT